MTTIRRLGAMAVLAVYCAQVLVASADEIPTATKVAHPIDAVFEQQGYELVERIWGKRLDRASVKGDAQP